jgi:hypothetical protein
MNLGDDDLQLFCVIEGETEGFKIDVEGSLWRNLNFVVSDLKEKIQEKRKDDSLAGVGAHSLVLWKVCHRRVAISNYMAYLSSFQPKEGTCIDVKPKQTLSERVASARESEEELDFMDSVLTVFPVQPRRDHLHIVVRKPDTGE